MRESEARLDGLHWEYLAEADKAEAQARMADQEAERLEREIGSQNKGGWQ